MKFDRRTFIRAGVAGAIATSALRPAYAASTLASDAGDVFRLSRELLRRNAGRIAAGDFVALVNYAAPSWRPRFHLVDMENERVASFLVSHGRGSDPGHSGWLRRFSNEIGSKASSSGAYRTGARYVGKHGQSMRLTGLDPENSNAERRAIVVHAAWYVSREMIAEHGKIGRSEGCFALPQSDLGDVLGRLGPGRLLYAGRF